MKHWTPEHLAIARAAIEVRDELRRLALTTLPPDAAESVKRCCWLLSHGLKERAPEIEPRRTGAQQEWKR